MPGPEQLPIPCLASAVPTASARLGQGSLPFLPTQAGEGRACPWVTPNPGSGDQEKWGGGPPFHGERAAPGVPLIQISLYSTFRWDGEGLSLTLQPSFGVTDTRLDELWSLSGDGDPAISTDRPGARLDARLAYGFPLGNALLTPYTKLAWEETTSADGAGLRYGINRFLELDLKGAHHRRANGNDENRFSLDMRSQL